MSSAAEKLLNVWQALAWLRWEDATWCARMEVDGRVRYAAPDFYPNMQEHFPDMARPPAEKRTAAEAAGELLNALRAGTVTAYLPDGPVDRAFWLCQDNLLAHRLPSEIRFGCVKSIKTSYETGPFQAAIDWMNNAVEEALTAGRTLKAKSARADCCRQTGCTTRAAEAAWKAVPASVRNPFRGRPKASPKLPQA